MGVSSANMHWPYDLSIVWIKKKKNMPHIHSFIHSINGFVVASVQNLFDTIFEWDAVSRQNDRENRREILNLNFEKQRQWRK